MAIERGAASAGPAQGDSSTTVLGDGIYDVPPGKLVECITHLEMSAPVALRPEPAGRAFELRRMERADPTWYRELFLRVGADWLWTSRLQLDDTKLLATIADPAVQVRALRLNGRDEGLLELDFRVPGECEIAFFGLTPRLVGQGAGRWLMNRTLEIAWSTPIGRLWVHTCSFDHPGALAFYRRSGFRPFRRQVEISDDPRLIGLLPKSAAPHIPIV